MPPATFTPAKTKMSLELKHTAPLFANRFDPSGKYLFVGAQDNNIIRWELENQKKTVLEGHRSWMRGLTFHADSKKLLSADYTGKVLVWPIDADEPKPERIIDAHRGWVRAIVMAPDGASFATCGNDTFIKLWSFPECRLLETLRGHESHVYNIAYHPNGKHLVSGDLMGEIKHWDLEKNAEARKFDGALLHKFDENFRAHHGGIRSMTFNGDGSLLLCSGITNVTNAFAGIGNPVAILFNWESGRQQQVLRPLPVNQGTAWGVQFHPGGLILGATGGSGGVLFTWQANNANAIHSLTLPTNARDLHLHPENNRIAIPFFDGAARIYELSA